MFYKFDDGVYLAVSFGEEFFVLWVAIQKFKD